jgi:hypothetical protein
MNIYIISIILFFLSSMVNANAEEQQVMIANNALMKMTVENIQLTDKERLGWIGASYLLETYDNIFVGTTLYGAVTGQRGGFFSLGAEALWRNQIKGQWFSDIGIYIGGGGGGGANNLVGGGLTVRPYLDILYQLNDYQLGMSASQVQFPYGTVTSRQLGFVFVSSQDFYTVKEGGQPTVEQKPVDGGLGFHRVRGTMASYHGFLLRSDVQDTATMLGARSEHWITPTSYWGVEVVGGAGGKLGGYAEYLGFLGVEYPVWADAMSVGARIGIGMGGGAAVLTQGGMLAKAAVNLTVDLTDAAQVSLERGVVEAVQGAMQAQYFGVELTIDLDNPYIEPYYFYETDYVWHVGVFNYHTVTPNGSANIVPFSASEVVVNRFANEHTYYGIHMMYAAKGGKYGGYGAAFVDLGYRMPLFESRSSLALEVAIGGGGGGGASVGGGALYMGNIYTDYQWGNGVGIRLGMGRLKAFQGTLDTAVTEFLVTYEYTVKERR